MNNQMITDLKTAYNTFLSFALMTNETIGQTFHTHDSTTVIEMSSQYTNDRNWDINSLSENTTVESIHNNAIIEEFDCVVDDRELGFARIGDVLYFVIRH